VINFFSGDTNFEMKTHTFLRRLSTLTRDRFPALKRGNFAILNDNDVQFFERILDKNQMLTDPEDVQPFNKDWLGMVCGEYPLEKLP